MRDLDQDARAVARGRVGADSAAVLEVFENGNGVVDELVGRTRFQIDDEADAARIVLALSVKQASVFRRVVGADARLEKRIRSCLNHNPGPSGSPLTTMALNWQHA